MTLIEKLKESSAFIRNRTGEEKTDIAIVLGSGLGDLADELEDALIIDYKDIPHFPVSTVPGHKGRLVIGKLEGRRVLCMQGRFHFYEGWSMQECVYPVQVFRMMGIEKLFLTNAAGCVNTLWSAGDLMVISDHIKLALESPLRGSNPDELGPRFFDMSSTWSENARNTRCLHVFHRTSVRDSCRNKGGKDSRCRCCGYVHRTGSHRGKPRRT